jgi:putative transcriptional regulator
MVRLLAVLALALAPGWAMAQAAPRANGLFLIAKPSLTDPNFARTVVLVTQAEDASTVGVIINRPTRLRLAEMLPGEADAANYRDAVYEGGPVMRQVIVALFRSGSAPGAAAFHVLKDLYLTMHADNLRRLLAEPGARYRLYAGFAGWAPGQLQSEFMSDGWHVLAADEETLFRKNPDGLWEELLERATGRGPRAQTSDVQSSSWPSPGACCCC